MSTEPTDAQPPAWLNHAGTWLVKATHILDTAAQHFGLEQDRSELLDAFNTLSDQAWTPKDAQQGSPAPASPVEPVAAPPVYQYEQPPPPEQANVSVQAQQGSAEAPPGVLTMLRVYTPVDAALAEQVRVLREALALLERHVALNCFDQWDIDRNGNWLDKVKSSVLSELLAGAQDALAATAPDGEAQG